jgi:hypothetical protein
LARRLMLQENQRTRNERFARRLMLQENQGTRDERFARGVMSWRNIRVAGEGRANIAGR